MLISYCARSPHCVADFQCTAQVITDVVGLDHDYQDLEEALEMGMDWSLREGYAWAEDKEHCEE